MRSFAIGAALVLAAALPGSAAASLRESGSTLMYPLFTTWARLWVSRPGNMPVETEATGSGRGVADVVAGNAELGVTDAYEIDAGSAQAELLQVPLAISAVQVTYNIPEIGTAHVNFTGALLADVYSGKARHWDDAQIIALNPTLARLLPHREIVTFHRADSSGTTFVFSEFLSASARMWKAGPGFGNIVHWPAGSWARPVVGNAGVLHGCEVTPYSIGYMGVSYRSRAESARLGYAAIRNADGAFVLPSPSTLQAAAVALLPAMPDDARISIVNAPGANSYPIANYEYVVVRPQQPDAATAFAVAKFLTWAVAGDGGNADELLAPVNFSALPASVRDLALHQIHSIH